MSNCKGCKESVNMQGIETGNVGLDSLIRIYLSHRKNLGTANRISQARVAEFELPTKQAEAVLVARSYKTLLDALQNIVGGVVADFLALRMDVDGQLVSLAKKNQELANRVNKKKVKK